MSPLALLEAPVAPAMAEQRDEGEPRGPTLDDLLVEVWEGLAARQNCSTSVNGRSAPPDAALGRSRP